MRRCVLLVLAVLAVGCGGSDTPPGPPPEPTLAGVWNVQSRTWDARDCGGILRLTGSNRALTGTLTYSYCTDTTVPGGGTLVGATWDVAATGWDWDGARGTFSATYTITAGAVVQTIPMYGATYTTTRISGNLGNNAVEHVATFYATKQ